MLRRVGERLRNHGVSPVREKGLRWEGFAKKGRLGFEPGMKERGSDG